MSTEKRMGWLFWGVWGGRGEGIIQTRLKKNKENEIPNEERENKKEKKKKRVFSRKNRIPFGGVNGEERRTRYVGL